MNVVQTSVLWFKTLEKTKQYHLSALFCVIFLTSIALLYWSMVPHYAVLFNDIDEQDANVIISQLEAMNIHYAIRHEGKEILIDKPLVDKTRIKLLGEGLQLTHAVGFELFDKSDFGLTDFSQKVNYQRALQGELERTINSLDEVKQTRVHLVIPEDHLFSDKNSAPRASVTLHLTRPLQAKQVFSIQQLIAASVPKLRCKNIVIIDQNGNALTAQEVHQSDTRFSMKQKLELYLNEKVLQLLKGVFNDNEFMVKIDVTLNFDSLESERIKPEQNGIITHEKEVQHNQNNKPDAKTVNQDKTIERSFEIGQEKQRFTKANGSIERLTISVALPIKTTEEQINRLLGLVKSAVGFNAKRGDIINMEAVITTKPIQQASLPIIKPVQPTNLDHLQLLSLAIGISSTVAYGIWRIKKKRQRAELLSTLQQWLLEHE